MQDQTSPALPGPQGLLISESPRPEPAAAVSAVDYGELSLPQRRAIGLLAGGASIRAAAEGAGIGRSTLHRWLREDPHFRAAHNAWQEELMAIARSRVLGLADSAVNAVAAALENREVQVGLAVLMRLGLLAPRPAGSSDPEVVKHEIAEDQRASRVRRQTRSAKLDRDVAEAKLGTYSERINRVP